MQDIAAMLEAASKSNDRRGALILSLLSKTGLQEPDLTGEHGHPGLRVGDIDFNSRTIRIVGLSRETLQLDDSVSEQLQTYIKAEGLQSHDRIVSFNKKELREALTDLAVKAELIKPIKKRGKRFLWAPSVADINAILETARTLAAKYRQKGQRKSYRKMFRNYLLYRIIAATGIREAEAVGDGNLPGIHVQDISFERRAVIIVPKRIEVDAQPQEKNLDDYTLEVISKWIKFNKLKPEDKLFDITTRQVQRNIKRLAQRAEKTIKRCTVCEGLMPTEQETCTRKKCLKCSKWLDSDEEECDCEARDFQPCAGTKFAPVKVAYADLIAPHRFRAFIVTTIERKKDIYKAKQVVGHKSADVTARYGFSDLGATRETLEDTFDAFKRSRRTFELA